MKLAFAKDIEFTKTHHAQSTPHDAERRILEVCGKYGLTFDGFVLPYTGGTQTDFQLSYAKTGISKIYSMKTLSSITGNELKRNETGYRLELEERCKARGKMFLGWDGEYNDLRGTRCKILCVKHNHVMTPILNLALRRELNCPECEREIKLANRNGCKTIEEVAEKRRGIIEELGKEAGYKFVCWLSEQRSVRTTQFRCNCPHHGDWNTTTREPCDRGILICPDCLSERRSMESGEFNLKTIDKTRPTYLYVQKLGNEYIKVGFAANSRKRMQQQAKVSIYEHELIFNHLFEKGWQAIDLEKGLKIHVKGKSARKEDVPDGWTETRPIKRLPKVLKFIEEYISLNPSKPIYLTEWDSSKGYDYDDLDSWFPSFDEAA
ncbi:TPA: hypothetical protein ACGIMR_000541 [Salmonella enterica subsp. enterica serovar Javiana]